MRFAFVFSSALCVAVAAFAPSVGAPSAGGASADARPTLARHGVAEGPALNETATNEAAARAEVLATLESWTRGWAERDAALAVADYAEDTDWTNAFGDRFEGRDALQEGLAFIFSLDFVMAGNSEGEEYADVRFLTPDIALIRSKLVRKGQQFQDGETRPDRHVHHLRVLERRAGEWKIISHLISQAQEKR